MRRVTLNVVVAFALAVLAGQAVPTARAHNVAVNVTGGVAGSVLDIALNGGKVGQVTANDRGMASTAIDLSGVGNARIQAFVERCEHGRNVLLLVTSGRTMPKDEKCNRKLAGAFWAHKARKITVDLAAGTLRVQNAGMSTALKIGLAAGGTVAAIGAGVAAAGGGSSSTATMSSTTASDPITSAPAPTPTPAFDPTGTYDANASVNYDPAQSAIYIGLAPHQVLGVSWDGSIMTISGTSGSNWVTVSGSWDSSSGNFNLTGHGTVAGYPDITEQFQGTLSSDGHLIGDYSMGTGGHLPGGTPTAYTIDGHKN